MTRRPFPTVSSIRRATRRLLACTGAALALAAIAAGAAPAAIPAAPGGPILVVTSNGDGFGSYLPEILRGEGLNEFDVAERRLGRPQTLAAHDVVVLGHTSLSDAQVAMFSAWVQGGGNLVAMRPDKKLAGLLGLVDAGGTRDEGNLTSVAGGVTGASMRFHGSADLYGLAGASPVATLDDGRTPAVTLRDVGGAGGQAAAFTYDLARSVVYTRQGNPAWAGTGARQQRRGDPLRRHVLRRHAARLGRPQPRPGPRRRRAAADAGQPRHRHGERPHAAAALLVPAARPEGGRGPHGRRPQLQPRAAPTGSSTATWPTARPDARSRCGSACARPRYLFPGTSVSNAQVAAFQAAGLRARPAPLGVGQPRRADVGRRQLPQLPEPARPWPATSPAARVLPPRPTRALAAPVTQPQPLHHLERLVQRAERRARAGHPPGHELLLLARLVGRRTGPASSPARASRSASPRPTAR